MRFFKLHWRLCSPPCKTSNAVWLQGVMQTTHAHRHRQPHAQSYLNLLTSLSSSWSALEAFLGSSCSCDLFGEGRGWHWAALCWCPPPWMWFWLMLNSSDLEWARMNGADLKSDPLNGHCWRLKPEIQLLLSSLLFISKIHNWELSAITKQPRLVPPRP